MSRPDRAVFRLPAAALFLPVLLLFCITPLATVGPWWGVLFAVPALALVWVVVARTTANPAGVTAHGLLGSRRMAWSEMDGLEFRDSRWAIAVGLDGNRLRLPMVRPRDLPALTSVSGGSLLLGEDAPQEAAGEPDGATDNDNGDQDADNQADAGPAGVEDGVVVGVEDWVEDEVEDWVEDEDGVEDEPAVNVGPAPGMPSLDPAGPHAPEHPVPVSAARSGSEEPTADAPRG